MPHYVALVPSPLGDLTLTASDTALTGVSFPNRTRREIPEDARTNVVLETAARQLTEYFAGARTAFDLPLDADGTEFEHRVWHLLRAIPYGTTTTYGDLARRLGDVKATRAVGAANGKNPIPIVVPCHRVIGARGELTGFGGGVERKLWLLEHEGSFFQLSRR